MDLNWSVLNHLSKEETGSTDWFFWISRLKISTRPVQMQRWYKTQKVGEFQLMAWLSRSDKDKILRIFPVLSAFSPKKLPQIH